MKLIIDIPDTDIPKRQDILSIDLCFIDGQVGQCTYPFEVLQEEPKTRHWTFTTHYARRYRICPFCNVEREDDRYTGWNFCPNCGEDMRGEDNEVDN